MRNPLSRDEFRTRGPMLTEAAAREAAIGCLTKLMVARADGRAYPHAHARLVFEDAGLWVPDDGHGQVPCFRDAGRSGILRTIEPRRAVVG